MPAGSDSSPIPRNPRRARTASSSACGSIALTDCCYAPPKGPRPNSSIGCRATDCRWCKCFADWVGATHDHVGADFRLGMTLAVEHFIRLGHRRIAFVGGGRHASPALDRAHAYRETLTRYGLPIRPIVNCLPTREEGERAVDGLMRGRSDDPTAIVCHNDLCAIGVLVGLSDRGLVGGKDCAVIGFDNIPEAAHSRPALTTIDIGARQIGVEAAPIAAPQDQGPDRPAGKHRLAPTACHSLKLRRPARSGAIKHPALTTAMTTAGSTQGGRRR